MPPLNSFPVSFSADDIEIISKKTVYQGFFTLDCYTFRHRLFDGNMSDNVCREIFERGHSAAILAYDPHCDSLVLVEQLRIAALSSNQEHSPWLLELIAGMIEVGENAEAVARREAEEEAGITIKRCKKIMSYLSSPGGTTERISLFIGEVDSSLARGTHGLSDEHEDILVHVVDRQQAYHWIESGAIDNAASILAIQWLQLNYAKLQKEWLD